MSTVSDRPVAPEPNPPENRLPLEEKQFDALFAAVSDAVYIEDLESREIVYWSPAAMTLFGYAAADALGHTSARLHADEEEFHRAGEVTRKEVERSGGWRGVRQFRRADGRAFDATIAVSLLRSDRGNCAVVAIGRQEGTPVTGRGRMEKQRRDPPLDVNKPPQSIKQSDAGRKQRTSTIGHLLRNIADYAVFTTDTSGNIDEWNKEASRFFGYDHSEVSGKHLSLICVDNAAQALPRILQEAREQSIARYCQWVARKDGKRLYARVAALALWDDTEVQGFLFFLRDDSREPNLRQMLREKEQMAAIGTAASILAHEIGNPLNGISATVQLLEHCLSRPSLPSAESMRSSVHDLKSEVKRLTALLNEFKNIAWPQKLAPGPVDLKRLIQQLVGQVEERSSRQNVEVFVECQAELPLLNGDDDKLKQALLQVLDNALDAMPHGGRLDLKAYRDDRTLCVDIIDTGVGIPENLKVFDLFSSTKPDGIGLGLFLVQQIVLAHNGAITYASAPGKGTTFHVMFTLNAAADTLGVDFIDSI